MVSTARSSEVESEVKEGEGDVKNGEAGSCGVMIGWKDIVLIG